MLAEKKEILPEEKSKSYWNAWYFGLFLFLLMQVVIYYFITVYFK